MMRKISAHYIFPVISDPVKYGIINCDQQGKILEIINNCGFQKEIAALEFYDGIITPAFITHPAESPFSVFEKIKQHQLQNQTLSLNELIGLYTLEPAIRYNCIQNMGTLERDKTPGLYLISGIDFVLQKLTERSILRILIPPL
ncbi:MAG: hypothetical protein HC830_02835 [Bacteroidetes bacterium]|nr:hypothetical protein [Bacteroidota bacterium]